MSAVFEPARRAIHLVMVNGSFELVYRTCGEPYGPSDWSAPLILSVDTIFTAVLGIDRTVIPARLALVYGVERNSDGGRLHNGELYLKWFDGSAWEAGSLLVSEPGTTNNWYPNLLEDASGEIGLLYYKAPVGSAAGDAMFALIEYPAPPAEEADIRLAKSGATTTVAWDEVSGAVSYNVYRGGVPPGGLVSRGVDYSAYDHTCFEAGDAFADGARVSSDRDAIPAGTVGSYYLVSVMGAGGEGSLGKATDDIDPITPGDQSERPRMPPCP